MNEARVFVSIYDDEKFEEIIRHLTAKNIVYDAPTNRYADDIGQMFIGNYSAYIFDNTSYSINKSSINSWFRETGDLTPIIICENNRPAAIGNTFIYLSNHSELNVVKILKKA